MEKCSRIQLQDLPKTLEWKFKVKLKKKYKYFKMYLSTLL